MTLHIVGLGPGDASLLTLQARSLLDSRLPVLLRTRYHPTIDQLDPGRRYLDCDDLYAGATDFDAAYEAIARRALDLAADRNAVYAVPGHPLVAERTVTLVLEAARARAIETRVYPALSYADAAAAALGIDLGRVQLCDALDLRIDAQRPALISQIYDRDTAGALKLALLDIYPAEHNVALLRALGTGEATTRSVRLHQLDHEPVGYLDTLFVPALDAVDDVRRFDGIYAIVKRLNAPDGCPWDREQTHESLRPHLLEESYEVLEAIDRGDPAVIAEELGDLLLQVLMHDAVAERLDEFAFGDITEHISRKLIHRHPHVFGEGAAKTAEDVRQSWEALKQKEKPGRSILEGIPSTLPALAASQSIQGRARRIGFDWPDVEGPLDKLVEEVGEFARATGDGDREDEFGDILFVLANVAQRLGIDAEQALRRANDKFRRRFAALERIANTEGIDLKGLDLAGLDALWDRAKAQE